jgi:TRAP-type C4-dicarboxylate transport system substrate-binding protein
VLLAVNDDVLKKMPDDVKKILMDVSKEFESYTAEYAKKANDEGLKKYAAAGGKSTTLTDEQKKEWVALLPNLPDTAKELGAHGQAILERYCQELQKAGEPVLREWKFTY